MALTRWSARGERRGASEESGAAQFKKSAAPLDGGWRRNSFSYEAASMLKDERGIYIITNLATHLSKEEPFCNFQTPLYIGHSINIQKRFKNHTSGKSVDSIFRKIFEFRKHCFFWYKYLPKSSKDELRMREQELINVFGAPLNKINSVSQEGSLIGGFLD